MTSQERLPREELRLALVMNGGVSLAVWMGGVSEEIFRVVTRRHPVYAKLLDLTSTTARVDVVSGTSAGGVNGAALAVALIYGGDFKKLRRVWLDTGSFTDLLRPVIGENPGSLLQGDEFFLPRIEEALNALLPADGSATPADPDAMPMDLRLTTTLLTGVQGGNVDDLGTPLHDVDYRAYFHFVHKRDEDADFSDAKTLIPRLARAARSTASFPFAFEPSKVTRQNTGRHLKAANGQSLKLPRYVVDGGVLDNKPFAGARAAIFGMAAQGSVRRVLAYINPDPGDGPPGLPGGDAPSLATVLVEGVLNIPQSQTISDQLAAIDAHNEAVRTKKDSVVTIAGLDPRDIDMLPGQLYDVYRRRRLTSTFEIFVYQPLSDAARDPKADAAGLHALGKSMRQQMRLVFVGRDDERQRPDECRPQRVDAAVADERPPGVWQPGDGWLPRAWPDSDAGEAFDPSTWGWGLFPVEFGAKVLLDLLRMTQKLVELSDPAPPVEATYRRDDTRDWRDVDDPSPEPPSSPYDPDGKTALLRGFWQDTYDVLRALELRRADERADWAEGTKELLAQLSRYARRDTGTEDWFELLGATYRRMFAFLKLPERTAFCARQAYRIADLVTRLSAFACREVRHAEEEKLRDLHVQLARRLGRLASRFIEDGGMLAPPRVLYRLMQLEVIEYAFNDHDALNEDTSIELVQISGNSESPIGGKSSARDKLLGLQLAHFGAFYKRSWRANDWLYGRLAGAERMVKVLLNPERLHRHFLGQRGFAAAQIRDLALDSVASERLHRKLQEIWNAEGYAALIDRELAFLDDPRDALPDSLPFTARAITLRLHFGILADELPELIGAIHQDQADGASFSGAGEAMLLDLGEATRQALNALAARDRRTAEWSLRSADRKADAERHDARFAEIEFAPDQAQRWLDRGLLAGETLGGQAGSDLFTRTLAHTAATLQGTIASKDARLGPLSALFAAIKLPILGFYFATRGLLGQSRTAAALNGGAMVLGLALVLLGFFWTPDQLEKTAIPHSLVAIGWALLAYSTIVSALRSPLTAAVAALAIVVVLGFFIAQGGVDRHAGAYYALLGAGVFVTLVAASVRIAWLQWATGFVVIAFTAAWGSGWLATPSSPVPHMDVLVFAAALVIALALQVVQSSTLLTRAKTTWQQVRRRERVEAFASGMYVTLTTSLLNGNRVARAVITDVRTVGEAARRGYAAGDSIDAIAGRPTRGMAIDDFETLLATEPLPAITVVQAATADS